MILEQLLSGVSWEEEAGLDPTVGEVRVVVVGDSAMLAWREKGLTGNRGCAFAVSVRSLLLALRAGGTRDKQDSLDPMREPVPWTAEFDRQLRDAWLSEVDPPPGDLLSLAGRLGRNVIDVRARLVRLGCDPLRPGHALPGVDIEGVVGAGVDSGRHGHDR